MNPYEPDSFNDHHPACPGGCGQLADECTCERPNPLGSMRVTDFGPVASRAEHLQWCKDRALEYADRGDWQNALASMGSDLRKHPETADHLGMELGLMLAMAGQLSRPGAMREWIEGFN